MPYRDLRSFLEKLNVEGELRRIGCQVDWKYEIGAFTRKSYDVNGPALLFQNITDYPGKHVLTATLSTHRRCALALDLPVDTHPTKVIETFSERIMKPTKPTVVNNGSCKENVHVDNDIDLLEFPIPHWSELDANRYLGTFHSVITKDPDTGWVNVGMYRMMLHDEKTTGISILPSRHIALHYANHEQRKEPMPMAVAIGQDPINNMVAACSFPAYVSEWDMAGGLRKTPVELIRSETIELEVPATSEIILEGEVPLNERKSEGPLGEFTGYCGGDRIPRPVFHVNCITHRDDPIFQGSLEGKPVDEDHVMNSISWSGCTMKRLKYDLGIPGVRLVYFPPYGPSYYMCIVSLREMYLGHAKQVAEGIWAVGGPYPKHIIIVDEDVDPTNIHEVVWAINTRFRADRDLTIIPNSTGDRIDPSTPPPERMLGGLVRSPATRMLIEATWHYWPKEWIPQVAYPRKELMEKIEKKWKEEFQGKV